MQIARAPVERFTENQLAHFITFIQSPHITTDMPFGERKLRLSNGEQVIVPDVIRNAIPSRIVSQYLAFCKETIDEDSFKPLHSSSLFAILRNCSASIRKSLAGLDNFSSDGSNAFDQLAKLCDEIAALGNREETLCIGHLAILFLFYVPGAKPEEIVDLKKSLQSARNYLKLDYKTHISMENNVADHCSTFALSDASNDAWRKRCEHDHDKE